MSGPAGRRALISLDGVGKVFNGGPHPTVAVRDVTLEAFSGELILLLGPSGSGKTTLLSLMAGLARPTSGVARLYGRKAEDYTAAELQRLRARKFGFIFQTFQLIEPLTVRENVEIVLRFNGWNRRERRERALGLLRTFQVGDLAEHFPRTLSQGEKQRVAIARALANDAEILFADEPTGSLESRQGLEIIRLLGTQAGERAKCVIVASHDLRLADFAHRVFRMTDGSIGAEAPGPAIS